MNQNTNKSLDPSELPPTVFVVDDDAGFTLALRQLLESVHIPVETFYTAAEFLEHYDPSRSGCLILDVRMPDMSGLELLKLLTEFNNPLPVIMLSAYADVSTTVQAMHLGARDFLEKPPRPQQIIEKIQQALKDDQARYHQAVQDADTASFLESLTPRENEVLDLLTLGRSAKQVARELGISVRTVDFHRRNLLEKMGLDNVVQLTRLMDEFRFRQLSQRH